MKGDTQSHHGIDATLQQPEDNSDEQSTHQTVIVRHPATEHMLRVGHYVTLEVVEPKERKGKKNDSGHRPDDDAAIALSCSAVAHLSSS